jgi:hypothetical protein
LATVAAASCGQRFHVGAHLGQDDPRGYATDAWNRDQPLNGVTKGRKHVLDARIEGGQTPLQFSSISPR